ncbi:MAG: hypothetical protein VR71_09670 [Roseovarius sp. BRH_c41]|jgi:hypothetical protein|nr:MAG: hypothetical protein VR71_09670 [Roseovarius sp. BRH_c41]
MCGLFVRVKTSSSSLTERMLHMTRNFRYRIGPTGLNLMRIVMGSYFMALALGFVTGFDVGALFSFVLPQSVARFVGSIALLCLSISFMAGFQLRRIARTLVALILFSSLTENFWLLTPENLSGFWRDLALAAGVFLSYASLGRRELRRASIFVQRARVRRVFVRKAIEPHRISPLLTRKRPIQKEIRNALAVTSGPNRSKTAEDEPEVENIFANL